MEYYFDESGNWQQPGAERHRLVMGGVLFRDRRTVHRLEEELRLFMAEERLDRLHATDLTAAQKASCYEMLVNHLVADTRVLVHHYSPDVLESSSRRKVDEIYLDKAAGLVKVMALGDPEVRIHYDLKFHYAWPANVLRQMDRLPWYLKKARDRFQLKPGAVADERDRIRKKVDALPAYERSRARGFLDRLNVRIQCDSLDPFDSELESRLNEAKSGVAQALNDYFWSELWQHFRGQELMRERFRDRILAELQATESLLGMDASLPRLTIRFWGKQELNAGIFAADLACNLAWRMLSEKRQEYTPGEQKLLEIMEMEQCE